MQLHFAVLLAVAVILATAIDGVDSTTPEFSSLAATRLLRTGTSAATFDEARAIPGVESIATFFKSSSQKKLEDLVKSGRSTDEAFKFLKLDDAWDKLLSNPDFKVWMKYVAMSKASPKIAVIVKLREQFGGEANLAVLLQTATTVKGTKKTATRLQNTLYELWFNRGIRPGAVPEKILGYNADAWRKLDISTPQRQARVAYSTYLDKTHPNGFNTMYNW
ncbi:hypothetical protein PHYSODRAFT_354918 [Phytophthora sojae]|uniref:RxLR effector PexRD54 WY domain-containing protein n=2 Tax=Phytophthora sojae TaxID=67593 RepID=G4ZT42_PHYSP|nr:hypothetical protein PHYSODRAFT_354918 [Phytophthora sojae]AEK81392.1 Avh464 [Phytophthora sojae]AEK81393.1 Avh464 [Phytophthora sojae]EGZ12859.1 hypothetical protein PHYSODRAFT_354918 [Phytophthora sojae]|eukprot:XP_009530288.1 hypothetical protein PHYSODRAFT_354918 [Phytophthora sojae]